MHDSNHSHMSFFAGTFIGGLVGALSVLFLTSKEGQRMQRAAKTKFHHLEKAAEDAAQALPKRVRTRRKPTPK